MSKQYYTPKTGKLQGADRQETEKIFKAVEYRLKQRNLIRRKRKVQTYRILIRAAILYIARRLSLRRLSEVMAEKYKVRMSAKSWQKQLLKIAEDFDAVVEEYLAERKKDDKPKKILGFPTYATDATAFSMEGKTETCLRVHTDYDLSKPGNFRAVIGDTSVGESMKIHDIEPDCLYIADRAYGTTQQMEYMFTHNGEFLFRITPGHVILYEDKDCKKRMDFQTCLSVHTEPFSKTCYFKNGKGPVYKIRVVAAPLPPDKAEKAVKKVIRSASKKQHKVTAEAVLYAQWTVLATSLPSRISSGRILSAYRKRWQIELHFKRAKSLLHFHRLKRASTAGTLAAAHLWVAVTTFVCLLLRTLPPFFAKHSLYDAFALSIHSIS